MLAQWVGDSARIRSGGAAVRIRGSRAGAEGVRVGMGQCVNLIPNVKVLAAKNALCGVTWSSPRDA